MALSVGIYRHRSRRPFQQAIRQKYIVPGAAGAPPPDVETPGFLAAIRSQRKQFGFRGRLPDQYWRQRKHLVLGVAAAPPVVQEPSFLAATRSLRKQLGRKGIEFDVRWQLRWRQIVSGASVVPSPRDIGWLVSQMIKRGYGHNIRR